jgi:hypothetical protein
MNNSGASLIFIHNNIDYYALIEELPDHKKILSFGNDLLQEVKIIGENSPVQEMSAVQFEQVDATTIGITKKGIRLLKLYMSGMGEPSTHEFVLPAEIWHQVIDLLVVDDIWSAARCQLINKEMHDIVLSDLTWRNVYEDWTQTQTDPTLTHWYDRFVKEALWTRKVVLSSDVISRFNEGYYCEIKAIAFASDSITLHIDEHGDYTMGQIQHPDHSQFLTTVGSFPPTRSNLIGSTFEIADPKSRYLGVLIYKASYAVGGAYSFSYGEAGYSDVKLFDLTEEFIRKHKLQHIVDRWSMQFMGALSQSS